MKNEGKKAFHISGTDEHGTPILVRAISESTSPRNIVDYYYPLIRKSLKNALIHFDVFSRTTKQHHYELTRKFYENAKKSGYIYYKEVPILFCEHDKMALPDRLVKGTCPYCGAESQYGDHCEVCGRTYNAFQLKNPRCAICGNEPVIHYSKHAFFALSKLSSELERWIKKDVKLTKGVREHVLHWIKEGLQDWDITRNIKWGVPVSDLTDQVFYVWWDAPIGYVSFTKELFESIGEDWEKAWIDGDGYIVHFIGKDIIYHHVLFWPAMLMVNNFSLPNEIRVRGFATLEGEKMSKSRGLYISLDEFIEMWPAEYLRFYWGATTSESLDDGDFSLREFQERINKMLIGEIGNFVHRVLTLIIRNQCTEGNPYSEMISTAIGIIKRFETAMLNNQFDVGLAYVVELARLGNKLLSEKEPWKNPTSDDSKNTLFTTYCLVIAISVLLDSFLPNSAKKLRNTLYIKSMSTNELVSLVSKKEFISKSLIEYLRHNKSVKPLFSKIREEDIRSLRKRLRGG